MGRSGCIHQVVVVPAALQQEPVACKRSPPSPGGDPWRNFRGCRASLPPSPSNRRGGATRPSPSRNARRLSGTAKRQYKVSLCGDHAGLRELGQLGTPQAAAFSLQKHDAGHRIFAHDEACRKREGRGAQAPALGPDSPRRAPRPPPPPPRPSGSLRKKRARSSEDESSSRERARARGRAGGREGGARGIGPTRPGAPRPAGDRSVAVAGGWGATATAAARGAHHSGPQQELAGARRPGGRRRPPGKKMKATPGRSAPRRTPRSPPPTRWRW